jgi:hypothetical protein
MKIRNIAIFICMVLLLAGVSYGQLDDLAEKQGEKAAGEKDKGKDKDVTFSLHGFAQANLVVARNDLGVLGNKWIDSRYEFPRLGGTLQLELEGNAYDIAHFFSVVQVEYNATGHKTNFPKFYFPTSIYQYTYFTYYADFDRTEISKYPTVNVRETYVDLYSKHVTFRAGQQIISWGEIEGIEAPSDVVIPWDYTTMSNYFEYSRIGVTAANLSFHFANQQLQLIWIPLFQPTKLPEDSLFNRGVTGIKRPVFEVRNAEYAARLSGIIGKNFKYGLGYLYGFDDMPDTKITMFGSYQTFTAGGGISLPVFMPSVVATTLYYNRVQIPTLDLGIGMGDVLSWKVSANANFTKDLWGKNDLKKNSTVTYLTGPESPNIFAKIYLGLYLGQQWVINYTAPANDSNPIELVSRLDKFKMPNKQTFKGYGQLYPYNWILSGNIQRSFLMGDALDFQVRFALYTDPMLKKWDYVIYPYLMYKFTNGVSTSLGLVLAKRRGDDRHMIISETRYSF